MWLISLHVLLRFPAPLQRPCRVQLAATATIQLPIVCVSGRLPNRKLWLLFT